MKREKKKLGEKITNCYNKVVTLRHTQYTHTLSSRGDVCCLQIEMAISEEKVTAFIRHCVHSQELFI